MPHRRDVNNVWILRVDDDCAYRMGISKSDVLPRFTRIGGSVDAVAWNNGVANIGLARAEIKNFRIGGRYRDRADTGASTRQLAVSDVFPLGAVAALPETASHGSRVKEIVVSGNTGHRDHASADVRTDTTPFELTHQCARGERL